MYINKLYVVLVLLSIYYAVHNTHVRTKMQCLMNVLLLVFQSDLYYPRLCYPRFLRPKLSMPNLYEIQSNLYYSHLYYPQTSFIRGSWDQNLVRPSTADNRGLTVLWDRLSRLVELTWARLMSALGWIVLLLAKEWWS